MFFSDVLHGLMIGLPIMLTLGPISLLLLNQGLERGSRTAAPAAFGVASADLTLSTIAAITGSALVAVLSSVTPLLRIGGSLVVLWLAWKVGADARRKLIELRNTSRRTNDNWSEAPAREPIPARDPLTDEYITDAVITRELLTVDPVSVRPTGVVGAGRGALMERTDESITSVEFDDPVPGFTVSRGPRLAATFYGLTLMNPMTIVLMSAVVVAGGPGSGTAGWVVGMATASLVAHGGFVLLGSVLRTTCSPVALVRVGFVSAALMVGLSVHLVVG